MQLTSGHLNVTVSLTDEACRIAIAPSDAWLSTFFLAFDYNAHNAKV